MNIGDLIVHVYANHWVQVILGLMALNLAAGVVVSLYLRTFYLATVGDWLLSRALPYVGVGGILQAIFIIVPPEYIPDAIRPLGETTVWGTVVLALIGHIMDTLSQLPFFNPPSWLTDRPKPEVSSGT